MFLDFLVFFFCLLFIIVYKVFWLFDYFFHLYVGWALVFGLFMLDFVSNMLLYLIFFFLSRPSCCRQRQLQQRSAASSRGHGLVHPVQPCLPTTHCE
jgi:hypothetical protein